MPANIPSPIVGAGGAQRQNPVATLLLNLLGQAGNMGLQHLFAPASLEDKNIIARTSAERTASNSLMGVQGTPEQQAVQSAVQGGLGNANVKTQDVPGIGALAASRGSAPERLAQIQKVEAATAENAAETARQIAVAKTKAEAEATALEARKVRFLAGVRRQNPALVGLAETLWNASPDGNIDASVLTQSGIIPPDALKLLQIEKTRVDLDVARQTFTKNAVDAAGRKEAAARLGVPEGMITTELMSDLASAKSPEEFSQKLWMEYSKPYTDPLTFTTTIRTPAEIKSLVQGGVQAFFPGYMLPAEKEAVMAEIPMLTEAIIGGSKLGQSFGVMKEQMRQIWQQNSNLVPADFDAAWKQAASAAAKRGVAVK